MGYETKLIIGKNTNAPLEDIDASYVSVIATIDLCKSVFYDTWIDKDDVTKKVFFYGSDGNTVIKQDSYGNPLYAIDPIKVLNMMIDANREEEYRRYQAAIPMLESLIKTFEGENLICILYGH